MASTFTRVDRAVRDWWSSGTFECCSPDFLLSPAVQQFWEEKAQSYGPTAAGALFGGGWWFWIDAVVASHVKVPFLHFLPGIVATIALVMINAIRRDELLDYDPFDEGLFCRARLWLFMAYVVSFGSFAGAVWVLLQAYALNPSAVTNWPGAAGVFQVILILGSALTFFVSRTPAGESSSAYSQF